MFQEEKMFMSFFDSKFTKEICYALFCLIKFYKSPHCIYYGINKEIYSKAYEIFCDEFYSMSYPSFMEVKFNANKNVFKKN